MKGTHRLRCRHGVALDAACRFADGTMGAAIILGPVVAEAADA
ncbi:hypothetical protein [Parafrankia sp. FMc2]